MHTKFHEDWYRRSNNIKDMSRKFERHNVGITDLRDYDVRMCGMIFLPSLMTIDTGVQAILRFSSAI
jgi:hypothetical protein